MRKSLVITVFLAASVAACATPAPITMASTYSASELAWAQAEGNNTIAGSAVLRTVGGDVKTCAGLEVGLIPVGSYTSELMAKTFGSSTTGYAKYTPNITLDPSYGGANRKTVCNPQGEFAFSNLPDGEYFVVATVTWGAVTGGRYAYIAHRAVT